MLRSDASARSPPVQHPAQAVGIERAPEVIPLVLQFLAQAPLATWARAHPGATLHRARIPQEEAGSPAELVQPVLFQIRSCGPVSSVMSGRVGEMSATMALRGVRQGSSRRAEVPFCSRKDGAEGGI